MRKRFSLLVVLAVLLATFGLAPAASADEFTVNTTDDHVDVDGCTSSDCSLREAVIASNDIICSQITVPAGTYTLTLPGVGEDAAATGDLDLLDFECGNNITGADARTTIIDGNGADRVFDNLASGSGIISNITITNGDGGSVGGGGLRTNGRIELNDVTVRDNSTSADGGGILNTEDGRLVLVNSTVGPNNEADEGGGVWSAGFMDFENATISGNTASTEGGGVYAGVNTGSSDLDSATITDNSAPAGMGGGIFHDGTDSFAVIDTIVANNAGGDCNAGNGISSFGFNLSGDDSCNFSDDDDLQNTDPLLDPLANNGGPTDTHALQSESPAIDSGSPSGGSSCLFSDQRGVARPQGEGCDRGAFELTTQGIAGRATDRDSGAPLENAEIDICPNDGSACTVELTDADGNYFAPLPPGTYDATGRPPVTDPPSDLLPITFLDLELVADQTVVVNFPFRRPEPPPPPGTIAPSNTHGGSVSTVFWQSDLTIRGTGCPGGTASYLIVQGATHLKSGSMAEGPAGTYTASVSPFFPEHGYATVQITIDCPNGPSEGFAFDIYIDPSGFVRTIDSEGGAPIADATVTLLHSDSQTGPFEVVPNGSGIMSPANRTNPDMTDAEGHFGWDVIEGFYKVQAQKDGCTAPDGSAFAETGVLTIPPPVTDLDIRLSCGTVGGTSDAAIDEVKIHGKVHDKDKPEKGKEEDDEDDAGDDDDADDDFGNEKAKSKTKTKSKHTGHNDVEAEACNVGQESFVIEPGDVTLQVLVNGTPTTGSIELKNPKKVETFNPGKCKKWHFRWNHGVDELDEGDTVEVIATVSGIDPADGNPDNDSMSASTTVDK